MTLAFGALPANGGVGGILGTRAYLIGQQNILGACLSADFVAEAIHASKFHLYRYKDLINNN